MDIGFGPLVKERDPKLGLVVHRVRLFDGKNIAEARHATPALIYESLNSQQAFDAVVEESLREQLREFATKEH